MSLPLNPDANHPAFSTRSQVDDCWETKRSSMPRTWRGSGRGDWDARIRMQNSRKNIIDTLASQLFLVLVLLCSSCSCCPVAIMQQHCC